MILFPTTLVGPVDEPVSVDELKAHTRVDAAADEALLLGYLLAAREEVESYTSLRLMPQTVRFTLYGWPSCPLRLGVGPVRSIAAVSYTDALGASQTLPGATYITRVQHGFTHVLRASGASWPTLGTDGTITVDADVGYADANAVPEQLRLAIMMRAAQRYEGRLGEASDEAFFSAINPYRMPLI